MLFLSSDLLPYHKSNLKSTARKRKEDICTPFLNIILPNALSFYIIGSLDAAQRFFVDLWPFEFQKAWIGKNSSLTIQMQMQFRRAPWPLNPTSPKEPEFFWNTNTWVWISQYDIYCTTLETFCARWKNKREILFHFHFHGVR